MYLKLLQKKVIHKIAEATGDLMGNKIGKKKIQKSQKIHHRIVQIQLKVEQKIYDLIGK